MTKKRLRKEIEQIKWLEVNAQALYLKDNRNAAGEREAERKADTRKKIQLGGAVIAAGLGETPYPELMDILTEAKAILDWQREGKAQRAPVPEIENTPNVDADPIRNLVVRFKSMPTEEAKRTVQRAGFKYDRTARKWVGKARAGALRSALERAGAAAIGFVLERA